MVRDKLKFPLTIDHPRHGHILTRRANNPKSPIALITYRDIVQEFALSMQVEHANLCKQWGEDPTYPYGPAGLSSDGLLVSLARVASGELIVSAQSIEGYSIFGDRLHGKFSASGPVIVETDARIAFRARVLGLATLTPCLSSKPPFKQDWVDISRGIDYSATEYGAAYTNARPAPIGSLSGGVLAPQPIFPLDAFLGR
ncbi:MAG TPA: hypothetical protein VJ836_07335 [Candidatus Saccharimonadales bacterium]|nr:hypothetical protein [Candidatus Saccharimonadales bacterium]